MSTHKLNVTLAFTVDIESDWTTAREAEESRVAQLLREAGLLEDVEGIRWTGPRGRQPLNTRVDVGKTGKPVNHGTTTGYYYHGCRCPECRTAATEYQRSRRTGNPEALVGFQTLGL